MAQWLSENLASLSAVGAAAAFVWSAIQFIIVRRREQRAHEFEAYHKLIKELVQPDSESKSTWIDRQVAVVFELRHFKRYFPVTQRILTNLREKFVADPEFRWPYLLQEIDLTLQYIGERSKSSFEPTPLRGAA